MSLTELEELSRGDKEFIKRMLKVFVEEVPGLLTELQRASDEKNAALIGSIAHRMRPSFSYLGRNDLGTRLEEVEEGAVKSKIPLEQVDKQIRDFIPNAEDVLREAKTALIELNL